MRNPEIRLQQYKEALDWYLENTGYKILLVENSGFGFSDCYQKQINEGRLELLCYNGNDYDRTRGKGYGEATIIGVWLYSLFSPQLSSRRLAYSKDNRKTALLVHQRIVS